MCYALYVRPPMFLFAKKISHSQRGVIVQICRKIIKLNTVNIKKDCREKYQQNEPLSCYVWQIVLNCICSQLWKTCLQVPVRTLSPIFRSVIETEFPSSSSATLFEGKHGLQRQQSKSMSRQKPHLHPENTWIRPLSSTWTPSVSSDILATEIQL